MNKYIDELKKIKEISFPEWARFVKTGVNSERPPVQEDWWYFRTGAILRKIEKFGPIGVNRLAKQFGGRKNRGHKPDKKVKASRKIIRVSMQQLEKSGLIKQVTEPKTGKILTKKGKDLVGRYE